MTATLSCCTETRRHAVRERGFNGIDYVEVSDDQTQLTVYFLGEVPEGLGPEHLAISGGRRTTGITVTEVKQGPKADQELDACLIVTVDRPGDFSDYTLSLIDEPDNLAIDPRYRSVTFSFKAGCPADTDCKDVATCPPDDPGRVPDIDYLAKDYASFRQLLLDRLAVTVPDWKETHVPDIGVTLVELLAYAGDYLSYHQDAVATEAYLDTARQRISVRRHVRLVDYHLHEGCNARTWVAIDASTDTSLPADDLWFLTRIDQAPDPGEGVLTWADIREVPAGQYTVFEPMVAGPDTVLTFRQAHNRIPFYTWGDQLCRLSKGATSATLIDGSGQVPDADPVTDDNDQGDASVASGPARVLDLAPGDVLILAEVIGPETANPADADPARRHAVRLTAVERTVDPLNGQPVVEIAWAEEDALPFDLCLSVLGPAPDCAMVGDVSIALGNVVLADHGRRLDGPQEIGAIPQADMPAICLAEGRPADHVPMPGAISLDPIPGPLTHAESPDFARPASAMLMQDPAVARPVVDLTSTRDGQPLRWTLVRDLLASGADDAHAVLETDDRGLGHLRFGDGMMGRSPEPGAAFHAQWRIGNGPSGNLGAGALVHTVTTNKLDGVRLTPNNPLPATGGVAPQDVAEAKLFAPHAFRQQIARAITPADYAEIASRHPGVQRAAAEQRWNGSWYEMRVAIDALGTGRAPAALLAEIDAHLRPFRRICHDLAVVPAEAVPLDIVMEICVEPEYLRAHVKTALVRHFGTGTLVDGTPAVFHPDALTFGQDVAASRLVAAALTIEGVQSAEVRRLERQFEGPNGELAAGVLRIGPLEVAQISTDPNTPEGGRIAFDMRGGR